MFHVTILGSGSAGNCALVETDRTRLLIDGGLNAKQITMRLEQCGVTPEQIDGILITHEHSDHMCGLDVWCKKHGTPVYCNRLTAEALRYLMKERAEGKGKPWDWRIISTGSEFEIGGIGVQCFPIPHDAAEPVGFALHHSGASLGFLTDLGLATKLVYERMRKVQTIVIETNHDEKLLQDDTRRPWSVKQRIMSRHGHLSNTAAAAVLGDLLGGNLRRAVLGHLSRDCNRPDLAIATVRERLGEDGCKEVEVYCAGQAEISPRFAVATPPPQATQVTQSLFEGWAA